MNPEDEKEFERRINDRDPSVRRTADFLHGAEYGRRTQRAADVAALRELSVTRRGMGMAGDAYAMAADALEALPL